MRLWPTLLILLAGCTQPATVEEMQEPDPVEGDPLRNLGATPAWEPGQSWTYRTDGFWDSTDSVTIVAVPDGDGWLLAGAGPNDLIDEVAWDHWHFGPVDLSDREGVLIAFPLEAGSTWTLYGQEMVVEAANITWAGGTEPGFRARAANERLLVEYAPSAGFITLFESRSGGELEFGLRLTATGTASSWTYVERLAEGVASGGTAEDKLEVPEGADEVIAWMLTAEGSHNFLVPPASGPSPQTFEGRGGTDFEIVRYEAVPGTWLYGGGGSGEDTYMQLHAVDWNDGTV